MQRSSRRGPKDEELGKRDDDHKPGPETKWLWGRPRHRMRRILGFALAVLFVWLFVHYIPTDLGPVNERLRYKMSPSSQASKNGVDPIAPSGAPPRSAEDARESQHWYNGLIRYYKLAESLRGIEKTQGDKESNHNVLFAASSLKSVTTLIPMACEMARWNRNYVHMALLGRDEIPLSDILEMNGVDSKQCHVFWHDARADYAAYSSDLRMEVTASAGLTHIHKFMHPQALIMDDSVEEDVPFVKGIRAKAQDLGLPVIELPANGPERFMWMTRLDSGSLRSWHTATIDILVHAPTSGSGSLIRLLKSLQQADYTGLGIPRLTIELPADIDPATLQFSEGFEWPPAQNDPSTSGQPVLHHRISSQKASADERSVRLLESFYPARPDTSHILILSSQAEVSQMYYHYVKYSLLEYKYSIYGLEGRDKLLGFSLEQPSSYLNGSTPFVPPVKETSSLAEDTTAPFLWQAPNSNAALYFGDKWTQVHSFLTRRLSVAQTLKHPVQRPKLVSEAQPSWMEYFLEFMRVRGYSMLYPPAASASSSEDHAFVTVHNELYQLPEEFDSTTTTQPPDSSERSNSDESFTANPSTHFTPPNSLEEPLTHLPLHQILSNSADLPELSSLPLLSFDGNLVKRRLSIEAAEAEAHKFRVEIGGCSPDLLSEERAQRGRRLELKDARDLFCFDDDYENGVLLWDHLFVKEASSVGEEQILTGGDLRTAPPESNAPTETLASTATALPIAKPVGLEGVA